MVKVPVVSAHGVAMSLVWLAACGACPPAWRPARSVALQSCAVVTVALRGSVVVGQLLRKGGALKGLCVVHLYSRSARHAPFAMRVGSAAQCVGVNVPSKTTSESLDT